jgi:NAD(P)H-dependent flavin oxidoreductase YrpB (nitropropane dioxygenase family)
MTARCGSALETVEAATRLRAASAAANASAPGSLLAASFLVCLAVDRVSIPIVAGGGIADARALAAALALGADGVETGTRLVTVREAFVHENRRRVCCVAPKR